MRSASSLTCWRPRGRIRTGPQPWKGSPKRDLDEFRRGHRIGVNTIDLDAARRRGVAVCNMPGTNTQAVAEMTLLLMLATLRRLAYLDALTRAGKGWKFERDLSDDLGEL